MLLNIYLSLSLSLYIYIYVYMCARRAMSREIEPVHRSLRRRGSRTLAEVARLNL